MPNTDLNDDIFYYWMKKTGIPQLNVQLNPADTETEDYLEGLKSIDKNLAYREKPKELLSTIQTALTRFGYTGKDGKPLTGDGIYDENTASALSEFLEDEDDTDADIQKLSANLEKSKNDESIFEQDEKAKKAGFAGGKKDILSVFEKPLPNHSIQKLPDHLKDNGQEAIQRTPLPQEYKDAARFFIDKRSSGRNTVIYSYADKIIESIDGTKTVTMVEFEVAKMSKERASILMSNVLDVVKEGFNMAATGLGEIDYNPWFQYKELPLDEIAVVAQLGDGIFSQYENKTKKQIMGLFENHEGELELVTSVHTSIGTINAKGEYIKSWDSDYDFLGEDY